MYLYLDHMIILGFVLSLFLSVSQKYPPKPCLEGTQKLLDKKNGCVLSIADDLCSFCCTIA
jgi:hypothetical protein